MILSKFDGSLELHLPLLLHLGLVAYEVDFHVLRGVLLDLLQPVGQVRKCLIPRDVVGEENAVGTSVEDSSDGPE